MDTTKDQRLDMGFWLGYKTPEPDPPGPFFRPSFCLQGLASLSCLGLSCCLSPLLPATMCARSVFLQGTVMDTINVVRRAAADEMDLCGAQTSLCFATSSSQLSSWPFRIQGTSLVLYNSGGKHNRLLAQVPFAKPGPHRGLFCTFDLSSTNPFTASLLSFLGF